MKEFILYVLSFYGADSELYPELAFTQEEVEAATQQHIDSGADFAADSVDREFVRDIVLQNRLTASCSTLDDVMRRWASQTQFDARNVAMMA